MYKAGTYRVSSGLMAMWTHAEHPVVESQYEPNIALEDQAHEHILDFSMYVMRLRGEYVPVDGWAVALQLPFHFTQVQADFQGEDGSELAKFESIHHRDELIKGIGDPELSARWQALAPSADLPWSLELYAGVNVPLGQTEPDPFALGEEGEKHQHVFFGTGTWTPTFGGEIRTMGTGWALRLWAAGRLPLYANEHGYTGPGTLESGLGFMSGFGLENFSFLTEVAGSKESPAKWGDQNAENSGRTEVMINLAASYKASDAWSYSTMVKRPVYTAVVGGQMEMPALVLVSATYTGAPSP